MCCTTSDGGAARFRGIASVGKQATSDTGNCGRRKKQGVLKPHAPPCLSLAFDLRRVGSHTAASLPCSAVGAPSSAPKHEARGLPPIVILLCRVRIHLSPYPRSAARVLCLPRTTREARGLSPGLPKPPAPSLLPASG